MTVVTVAALYVLPDGPYYGIPGVEPWGLPERDARTYAGPHPVVAHPPCARWGKYWYGSPSSSTRLRQGDDDGCFRAALESVRRWGGVLEHPAASHAWSAHGLIEPSRGGWCVAGDGIGWTCRLDQGHYGHPAPKPTWLYAVRTALPSLRWHDSSAVSRVERLSHRERSTTPNEFRDLLLALARTASTP